jgi:phosphate/sulfate permease
VIAWVLTSPMAALMAGLCWELFHFVGEVF